jgi:hypothetical protein
MRQGRLIWEGSGHSPAKEDNDAEVEIFIQDIGAALECLGELGEPA